MRGRETVKDKALCKGCEGKESEGKERKEKGLL